MGMHWMSDYVEAAYSRWLATSFACCAPRLRAREVGPQAEGSMLSCHDQPDLIPPPKYLSDNISPLSLTSSRPSLWLAEGRDFASRVSSRTSFSSRRHSSRRPTIGNPSEFRRMESSSRCTERFRPLELSIYLPGNELSPLPSFSEDSDDEPMGLGLPAQVLMNPRPASIVSRPSTAFTIPRKPVGSMTNPSVGESRYSIDSHYPLPNLNHPSRAQSTPLSPKPPASQSTQDFLDSLDPSLLKSPPCLHIRSGSEPVFLLHRRASDQNLRLRTHLEERQEIQKRLNEFDAILEEKPTEPNLESLRVPSSLIKDNTIDEDPFLEPKHLPNPRKTRSMTSADAVSNPLHMTTPFPAPSKPLPRIHHFQLPPRNSLATKLLPAPPTPPRSRTSLCRLRASPPLPALPVSPTITSGDRGWASQPQSEQSSPPPLSRSGTGGSESGDSVVGTPGSEVEVEVEGCKEGRAGEGGFAGKVRGGGLEVVEVEVGLAF